jgi:hypothetical protein
MWEMMGLATAAGLGFLAILSLRAPVGDQDQCGFHRSEGADSAPRASGQDDVSPSATAGAGEMIARAKADQLVG